VNFDWRMGTSWLGWLFCDVSPENDGRFKLEKDGNFGEFKPKAASFITSRPLTEKYEACVIISLIIMKS